MKTLNKNWFCYVGNYFGWEVCEHGTRINREIRQIRERGKIALVFVVRVFRVVRGSSAFAD
jgi:hypothetical protein